MESFKEQLKNIETEASYYEIETDFAPSDIREGARSISKTGPQFFSGFYIISKRNYKFYLSLYGHQNILKQMKITDHLQEGGTIKINRDLKVIGVDGISGSLLGEPPSPQDFPLIKEIVQKYLDRIKK